MYIPVLIIMLLIVGQIIRPNAERIYPVYKKGVKIHKSKHN